MWKPVSAIVAYAVILLFYVISGSWLALAFFLPLVAWNASRLVRMVRGRGREFGSTQ